MDAALAALRRGALVLVADDADREDEGDFVGCAATATPAQLALVVRHSTGIVCAPLTAAAAAALELPLMVPANEDPFRTAFTVSVDYRHGTTTGVSAGDRATTLRALARGAAGGTGACSPVDFSRPGHIFPLIGRAGGVLVRSGHTEASIDLVRLAGGGHGETAFLAEVVSDDPAAEGGMARAAELSALAAKHDMPLISIADLQRYRYRREVLVEWVGEGATAGSSSSADASASRVGAWAFASRWMDNVRFNATLWLVGGEGAGGGGGGATAAPVVLSTFEAVSGAGGHDAHVAAALQSLRDGGGGGLLLAVCVSGSPWANVRGNDSARLATLPPDGPLQPEGTAGSSEARPLPRHKPAASCYASLFPMPPGAAAAGGGDGEGAPPRPVVCDRVTAELAQVIAAVLCSRDTDGHSVAVQPAYAAAAQGALEEAALAAARPTWPVVRMLVPGGEPLARVWEYGLNVAAVGV